MTKDEVIKKYVIPACERTWNERICKLIEEALLEPSPYADCISRQDAIDAMWNNLDEDTAHKVRDILEMLPNRKEK